MHPLLYRRRKFDLRVWALMTSVRATAAATLANPNPTPDVRAAPRSRFDLDRARSGEVREQPARRAVGGVDGAEEAPLVGQQLADGGGAQLCEEGAAVDRAEVREEAPADESRTCDGVDMDMPERKSREELIPPVVEPLSDDGEARRLLQVEARLGAQVPRRHKVAERLAGLGRRGCHAEGRRNHLFVGGQRRRRLGELSLDGVGHGAHPAAQLLSHHHRPQVAGKQDLLGGGGEWRGSEGRVAGWVVGEEARRGKRR